jgi:hypothetical protein
VPSCADVLLVSAVAVTLALALADANALADVLSLA